MSNSTSAQVQDDDAYEAALIVSYSYFSALCLYFFDVALTFDQQVEFIARRRLSLASVLLLLLNITGACLVVIIPTSVLTPTCESYWDLTFAYDAIGTVFDATAAAIAVLRVYAISRNNWWATAAVSALFLVEIFANIFDASTLHREASPAYLGGCFWSNGAYENVVNDLAIAALAATLTAHLLTLVVTWRSTFANVKLSTICGERSGLMAMLLRDGTLFFGTMLITDIVTIVLANSSTYVGFTGFDTALMTILLSRFILKLQIPADSTLDALESSMSDIGFEIRRSFGGTVALGDEGSSDWSPLDS